ncbi:MAG: tetratricopeptide repeat protein, partial [Chloroflexota bacterium]
AAIKLAERLDHQEAVAKIYTNLAHIAVRRQDFVEANQHYQAALDTYSAIHKEIECVTIQVNQATVHNLAEHHHEALAIIEQVLEPLEHFGAIWQKAAALQIQAEAHLGLGNLAEAAQFAHRVIQEEHGEVLHEGYRTMGTVLLRQGHAPEAEQHIRYSLELLKEKLQPFDYAYSLRALAEVYQVTEQAAEATVTFNKTIALFEELDLDKEVEKTKVMMK